MSEQNETKATYTDRYGRERRVRKTRKGWQVERLGMTVPLHLMPFIGERIGQAIRKARRRAGLSAEQVAIEAGLVTNGNHPKVRMYEIEKGGGRRKHGIKLGTLYAIAASIGVEPRDLLPTLEEVLGDAGVGVETRPRLVIASRD